MRGKHSWLAVMGIVLGALGAAASVVAVVITFVVSARARDGIDLLFDRIDGSLTLVGQRLAQTRDGIAGATASAEDLRTAIREAAKPDEAERGEWQRRVTALADRLASALRQADRWLEVAGSAVGLVQDRLSLTGVTDDDTRVDEILDRIATARAELAEAIELVVAASRVEPIGRATQLAERAIAAIGKAQSGLATLSAGVSAKQVRLQELRAATKGHIRLVTWAVALLLVWMGAGQLALCRLAWNRKQTTS